MISLSFYAEYYTELLKNITEDRSILKFRNIRILLLLLFTLVPMSMINNIMIRVISHQILIRAITINIF